MVSDAQATTKGAIMFLTNFIFISVISFHCFGLPWLPTVPPSFRTRGLRRARRRSFLAVHRSTERKAVRGYAKRFRQPRITRITRIENGIFGTNEEAHE